MKEKDVVVPSSMADMEWVWVLSSTIPREQNSIFVVDMEENEKGHRRIVPIFESRENASLLKEKLCEGRADKYIAQTMRLSDVGVFAARNELEIMMLDDQGHIIAHMEAKLEEHPLH